MQDLLLDENGDLLLTGGNLVRGESTEQHQRLLLISNPGDFKESPAVGVGVGSWLKDEDTNGILPEIKSQFEKDGMVVTSLKFEDNKIKVNAQYKTPSNPA